MTEPLSPKGPELVVVIPVFNEQASVRKVIREWYREIENWTEDFLICVIDDGSDDKSLELIENVKSQLDGRIEVHSRPNRGHGATCRQGYERAIELDAEYVFQIDSDGQCDPQYFFRLWRQRETNDVIYGWRRHREDGLRRVIAGKVLKLFLLAVCGVWCIDANSPYRLMRVSILKNPVQTLKRTKVVLTNVALAVLLKRDRRVSHGAAPIRFRERYGGEPSVAFRQFGRKATELARQLRALSG